MRTQWMVWILGLGVLGSSWTAAAEQLPAPSLQQAAVSHPTPEAVASFLRTEFIFQRDEDQFGEIDHWQSPEEFLQRRIGDCEDYALLAQALLRRNGIQAYVFSLFGAGDYAHTVSVFVDQDGRYDVINQGKLQPIRAVSLEGVAAALNPAWTRGMIAEQDGARGRVVREIVRTF